MQITVNIPDEVARQVISPEQDGARVVLEHFGLSAYRERQVTEHELQVMLGMETRFDVRDFLKAHEDPGTDTVASVDRDLANLAAARQRGRAVPHA